MLNLFARWLNRRRDRCVTRAQIRWGLEYIQDRYGNRPIPQDHNWYSAGVWRREPLPLDSPWRVS